MSWVEDAFDDDRRRNERRAHHAQVFPREAKRVWNKLVDIIGLYVEKLNKGFASNPNRLLEYAPPDESPYDGVRILSVNQNGSFPSLELTVSFDTISGRTIEIKWDLCERLDADSKEYKAIFDLSLDDDDNIILTHDDKPIRRLDVASKYILEPFITPSLLRGRQIVRR